MARDDYATGSPEATGSFVVGARASSLALGFSFCSGSGLSVNESENENENRNGNWNWKDCERRRLTLKSAPREQIEMERPRHCV